MVLHLFTKTTPFADRQAVLDAIADAQAAGVQIVTVAMLGHKSDVAVMAISPVMWHLRQLQTALGTAGLEVIDSYLSITEVSEYAAGLPEHMRSARLYPQLPPEGKQAWCFYPMSKRREGHANWFRLDFDDRKNLMYEHGSSGRAFAGRVLQLITASTGLDDYEWGVTLFGLTAEDLKDVVYTLRYDEASALYADFGAFYTGAVADPAEVLDAVGVL